jgi:hypothetical protein
VTGARLPMAAGMASSVVAFLLLALTTPTISLSAVLVVELAVAGVGRRLPTPS